MFLDFIDPALSEGKLTILKRLSTPAEPEKTPLLGLEVALESGILTAPFLLTHGTTVATNALLERKGAKTALLVTRGFRDLLFTARQNRAELYSLHPTRPQPLIGREDCYEVNERTDANGKTLTPLDEGATRALLTLLAERGYTSLAVCLMFAYLAPQHERRIRELAGEMGFGSTFVFSLSSEVAPSPREYERASTTVINAFVSPTLQTYLSKLESGVRELARTIPIPDTQHPDSLSVSQHPTPCLRIMQSNGGTMTPETAGKFASRTALSGPAGGVIAALKTGRAAGIENLICFDMGGTSADIALITGGECAVIETGEIGGLPLHTPQLDLLTVGAGGGSLVWRDTAGALRVGPQSAGAEPGPVAYGKGELLTVTDAYVLLGRLPETVRPGGVLTLNREAVKTKFAELSAQMGLSAEEIASGVIAICNATMTQAIRRISVERGRSPKDYWLLSYGGAGGLHACQLADATGCRGVLIPPTPGAFSALGLALADARHDDLVSLTPELLDNFGETDSLPEHWRAHWTKMESRAVADFERAGTLPEDRDFSFRVDLRYRGQSGTISIPVALDNTEKSKNSSVLEISIAFHYAHRQQYGYDLQSQCIEATAVRLTTFGRSRIALPKPAFLRELSEVKPEISETKVVPIYWNERVGEEASGQEGQGWGEARLYERSEIAIGQVVTGAAVISQADATTLVPPTWRGRCDVQGNLLLERQTD